jgi:hypothetical protein
MVYFETKLSKNLAWRFRGGTAEAATMVVLAALSNRGLARSTAGHDDRQSAEPSPRAAGGSSWDEAQRPSALTVFASAASALYSLLDGARDAESFAAEVSTRAADRQARCRHPARPAYPA